MTTLAAISFNLAGSVGVFAVTMVAFGCAVKSQNTFVAARCTARPPTVIYNPNPYKHPSQDRGHPALGWILWVMRLTYDTMLRGVPGTGTRDGGLSGALLKVNLDGIVLLRFHHLCLRVCTLATFLYLVVILPVYATSRCSRLSGDLDSEECQGDNYNLTDYQRLTLANIPTLEPAIQPETFWDVVENWFLPTHSGDLARLYAVVFVTWIVTSYALRELKLEWGDVLAMRRVYYLEADHWKDRNEELEQTLLRVEREKVERRNSAQHTSSATPLPQEDESYLTDRKPWIPHPEQRDTVPNIELYSVLVGGLPSLPTEVVDQEEVEAVFSRKQSIDWQLSVTTAFFDHCVPNQPGFSSSIAAVTILPSAEHLTQAWNQWYRVAGKLRRLRFIRREIAKRKKKEARASAAATPAKRPFDIEQGGGGVAHPQEQSLPPAAPALLDPKKQKVYEQSDAKKEYYQEVLGSTDDLQVESRLLCALDFGPEQTAAYSREFALGAANLAPYGWHEERVLKATFEELLLMERVAVEQVHEANAALREAQERIAEDSEFDSDDLSEEDLHAIMQNASTKGTRSSTLNPSRETTQTVSTSFDEEEGRSSGSPATPIRSTFNGRSASASRPQRRSSNESASFGSFASELDDDESFNGNDSGSVYQMQLKGSDVAPPSPSTRLTSSHSRARSRRSDSLASGSTHSTRSGVSCESGESRRRSVMESVGDVGKSVMKMTGLARSSSSDSLDRLSRRKKTSKANIANARLPSDLGLEAGLWMEQKTMSIHARSQHSSRTRSTAPSRGKSSLGASMHGIHSHHLSRSAPKRTRSSGDADILTMQASLRTDKGPQNSSPKPLKRTLSSDDVDLLDTSWAADDPAVTQSQDDAKGTANESSGGSADNTDSIWSRLERDKERKQRLRERLNSMQSVDESGDRPRSESIMGPQSSSLETRIATDSTAQPGGTDETPRRPQRVREYRTGNAARERVQAEKQGPYDGDSHDFKQETPLKSNTRAPARQPLETQSTSPAPTTMKVPRANEASESEASDDDSFDMEAINTTARAYGIVAEPLGASHRSISSHQVEDNLRIAFDFEEKAGLRHRDVAGENSSHQDHIDIEDKWTRVLAIVQESSRDKNVHYETKQRLVSSGQWRVPTFAGIVRAIRKKISSAYTSYKLRMKPPEIIDDLVRDSSYAVVTFTSRQAAVAARHCLTDSRGHDRWITVSEIPSPPLADAPTCNISSFRGCVRPVTLSISDKQKLIRHTIALAALACIYFFYTIPLVAAQQLVSPESLARIFPDILQLQENSAFLSNIFSGFIPALVWTAFFAVCPPMFKIIANFGSNATSSVTAENSALHYFWWFMLLSAFTGTSFSTAIVNGLDEGLNLGAELQGVIERTASTIPTQVSATWLNWMIVRVFAVLPTQYLLQLNTFIFSCLGLKCCARTVRGGGAGGPVPYRIYVDSGVVMLCVFALAPASPLIAPAAFSYFLFCTPMLRWTMIFLYRPKFDIGGGRFPFIFDICISGMVVGQILLMAMMTLKRAIGPAIVAFCPIIPTIWFRYFVRRRFLRAFSDAALLQTSLLDGWDTNVETSQEKREEFRRFLVDCHKAAYVPVCIAGDQSTLITAEPAVVVPVEFDEDQASLHDDGEFDSYRGSLRGSHRGEVSLKTSDEVSARLHHQPGAMARRTSTYHPPAGQMGAMMRRTSTLVQQRVTGMHPHGELGALQSSVVLSPRRTIGSPAQRATSNRRVVSSGPFLSPPMTSTVKPRFDTTKVPKSPVL